MLLVLFNSHGDVWLFRSWERYWRDFFSSQWGGVCCGIAPPPNPPSGGEFLPLVAGFFSGFFYTPISSYPSARSSVQSLGMLPGNLSGSYMLLPLGTGTPVSANECWTAPVVSRFPQCTDGSIPPSGLDGPKECGVAFIACSGIVLFQTVKVGWRLCRLVCGKMGSIPGLLPLISVGAIASVVRAQSMVSLPESDRTQWGSIYPDSSLSWSEAVGWIIFLFWSWLMNWLLCAVVSWRFTRRKDPTHPQGGGLFRGSPPLI